MNTQEHKEYKVPCFNAKGERIDEVALSGDIFDVENINAPLIHKLLVTERANQRQGTRKVKDRSEVRGGGRKPWRQKGTGNARHGSTRSPIWKGGGVVFGPSVKDNFSMKLPKKVKKLAFRSLLSSRLQDDCISVLRDFQLETYSTKKVYDLFETMKFFPNQTVCFCFLEENDYLKASCANIPHLQFISIKRPIYHELYYSSQIVFSEDSLQYLSAQYDSKKETESAK